MLTSLLLAGPSSFRGKKKLLIETDFDQWWWWRWQALDFARLSHSTVSFFDEPKPETAASRWNRVGLNASKVFPSPSLRPIPFHARIRLLVTSMSSYVTFFMSALLACNLQQVGQGLSRDGKALKLAFQHWIEAVSTKSTTSIFRLGVVFCMKRTCFSVCWLQLFVMCEHWS